MLVSMAKRSAALVAHAQASVSQQLLRDAGVRPELVRRAVERVSDALDAGRVQRIKVGDEIREFVDVDHRTRLSASDRVFDLASRASMIPAQAQSTSEGAGAIQVNIILADGQAAVAVKIGKHSKAQGLRPGPRGGELAP
jgi:hypothetical protein